MITGNTGISDTVEMHSNSKSNAVTGNAVPHVSVGQHASYNAITANTVSSELEVGDYATHNIIDGNTHAKLISLGEYDASDTISGNVAVEIFLESSATDNDIEGNNVSGLLVSSDSRHNAIEHNRASEIKLRGHDFYNVLVNNTITNDITLGYQRSSDSFYDNVAGSLTDADSSSTANAQGFLTAHKNTAYNNVVASELQFMNGHTYAGHAAKNTHDNEVFNNVVSAGHIQVVNGAVNLLVHDNTLASGSIEQDYIAPGDPTTTEITGLTTAYLKKGAGG